MVRNKNDKFIDKSQAVYEFYKNYANIVAPIFEEEEKYRKKVLAIFILVFIFVVCFFVLGFVTFSMPIFIIPIIVGLIALIAIPVSFRKRIKEKCMPLLIKAFGEIEWYSETDCVSDTKIRRSELFSTYNKRSRDDAFIGKYKGVNFFVSETNLWHESGSGKRKTVWPVFDGVIVTFNSNKIVKNKTIIVSKGDINVRNSNPLAWVFLIVFGVQILPSIGSVDNLLTLLVYAIPFIIILLVIYSFFNKKGEVLNEIKLEDPEFQKRYKAYSSDEIEGRYLITPAFMHRFKTLHTSFGTNKAKCSFYDNEIMFAISTSKNLFEIGDLFVPLTNPKQINTFLSEISAIYDLIDYFKLDEKTGI